MSNVVKVASFDAVGEPAAVFKAPDSYYAGPTDKGTYRMARCGKHSSPSHAYWSKIRWGSAIKEEGGEIRVMRDGKWQPLKVVSPADDARGADGTQSRPLRKARTAEAMAVQRLRPHDLLLLAALTVVLLALGTARFVLDKSVAPTARIWVLVGAIFGAVRLYLWMCTRRMLPISGATLSKQGYATWAA